MFSTTLSNKIGLDWWNSRLAGANRRLDRRVGGINLVPFTTPHSDSNKLHRLTLANCILCSFATFYESPLSTIIIPIGVDAVLLGNGHMNNPAWLPQAKLHCAMSFFAAISLGSAALAILKVRPVSDLRFAQQ